MTEYTQDPQIEEARLGINLEDFKASDVGRYLAGRAQILIDEAAEQLKTVDPEDAKEIRRLQGDIAIGENFTTWIDEAIQNGRLAEEQIHQADLEEPHYVD